MVDDWILVADMARGLLRPEWLAGDDSSDRLRGGEGSSLGAEKLEILPLAAARICLRACKKSSAIADESHCTAVRGTLASAGSSAAGSACRAAESANAGRG